MALKLYGLSKCSTCQKAIDWLEERKIAHSFSDVKDNPITKEQVAKWSRALGGWEKMINRAGYTWRGLPAEKTADLTEAKAVSLAVENPSLVRRPLIEHKDGSVTVGFSKKIQELLG
ncbi:Spx/MgsR family RNA polymerase-binding regulatory protein [Aestuariivirga sp.]|uniref:Spx/MgsR family RNA polymerase-binding regulatory protein n=1 Tax=Aestuariivirga sp. TaxID=2650926 RepID=UPI0035933DD6